MITNEKRIGRFTASPIHKLLTGKKTAQTYCLEVALGKLGINKDVSSSSIRHGETNQFAAYENIIRPRFKDSVWLDDFIVIDEKSGASPDSVISETIPAEIKCPTSIAEYLNQVNENPEKYIAQVNMQMMALNSDFGYLVFYLSRPETWGSEDWKEYDIPFEDRYSIFEIHRDEKICDRIKSAIDEYYPKMIGIYEVLKGAEILEEMEFFYLQKKCMCFHQVKDSSNIFGIEKAFKIGNSFYYKK